MNIHPISAAVLLAVASMLTAGCQDSTSKDVAEARVDAAKDVANAREKAGVAVAKANEKVSDARVDYADKEHAARHTLTEVESEAMIKRAHAAYSVATTHVDGNYDIAQEECKSLSGVDKTACISAADATRAADQAQVTAVRDSALVAADNH
jgi:hypothetical protein